MPYKASDYGWLDNPPTVDPVRVRLAGIGAFPFLVKGFWGAMICRTV